MGEGRRAARLERRLTESDAVLWAAVIVASVFDVLTTMTGLEAGLTEGNAVARAFIATYGTPGIGLLKFVALVVLVVAWGVLPDREASLGLAAFAVVAVLTIAVNAVTLLGV
ncbi:MAG: DUF5658 family protein [Halobacteriaceae archaeon]